MKQTRAIIADDEEALRSSLRDKLTALWPELDIVGEARDGEDALRLIHESRPDIAFLDIQMPGFSGIDVAKKTVGICLFVFITAYDKYAVEAFDHAAIDYLLKPVTDDRLEKTVIRLKDRLSSAPPDITATLEQVSRTLTKRSDHLQWIKAQNKDGIRLIPTAEVYYFKATDKYTSVRTRDGEFLIRTTLKELEGALDPDQFWRVHRAAIVNVKSIHAVNRSVAGTYAIRFRDIQDLVPVSHAYAHLFRQM